jgi:hypothetical protein
MTGVTPNYKDWRLLSSLSISEISALMHDIDPRALGDVTVRDPHNPTCPYGVPLDTSWEERVLISALAIGDLVSVPTGVQTPIRSTHILVSSLIPWLHEHGHGPLAKRLAPLQVLAATSPSAVPAQAVSGPAPVRPPVISSQPVVRLSAARAQEQQILDALKAAGHQPKLLPKAPPGKAGVKAQIRAALGTRGEWGKTTVFDKAWERLRSSGEITDQP